MSAVTLPDVNFRVYIGPYHLHYDWSGLNLGASFSLGSATSTTGQTSGTTTLVIASATNYGTAGGVFVGPNGSGQAWEYEQFTARSSTTLTVVRESTTDREHNGVHTSGAQVYQFYPVTTNDGQLTISEEADENVSTITWQATISGVRAPQHVLRNGHIVVVTTSDDGGSYTIALVGFVDSPSISDDYKNNAEWTLNVVSSAQIVGEVEARGVRVGDADLADAGSASSVTELVLPYDERHSGDFTQASPDLSAASAIDNELNTLWIAEHFTGTDYWSNLPNSDPENGFDLAFAHIYINPPPSAGAGARFIELRVRTSTYVRGFALNAANGGSGVEIWIFNGPGDVEDGGSIFLVEDEEVFSRLNPLAQSAATYENRTFFQNAITPTGGELWLRLGELNIWQSRVQWGDANGYINHEDAPEDSWSGPRVTAPAVGQTMRYIWTHSSGTASTYWVTDMVRHAGYNIDNDDPMWIMTTLPGLGLKLAMAMTDSYPDSGQILFINGPDDKYSTDGIPSSGTIFVGDEKISYSSKTNQYIVVSGRGASGTTAVAHSEGDEVYIMDGSVPTDAYRISGVGWTRGGSIYPKWFKLYTSNLIDNVRTPDNDDYAVDWTLQDNVTNNASNNYFKVLTATRVKHVLFEIMSMTTDPARPRLNEINAIVDPTYHDSNLWLAADTSAGTLISQVLVNAGIPVGAISHTGTPEIAEAVTADDNAWTVVADLAEYTGVRVTVQRDSKFTIANDVFWTGTPGTSVAWTRTNATSVQKSFRKVSPISQIILTWKTPDGSGNGKIYYPTTAGRGTKLEKQETLYASESAATSAARRLYFMRLYPFEVSVEAAGNYAADRAGGAHRLQWQFADDMQQVDRMYVVMSAEHTLNKGNWSSTFRLVQYAHESNF
jgi:hypothetical protein